MTLYLELGGRAAIDEAFSRLRQRLSTDPAFDDADFHRDFGNQSDFSEFLVFLVGGAPYYDGLPVNVLLAALCEKEDLYDRFTDHIIDIVGELGAPLEDAQNLRRLLARLRPQVLYPKPRKPVVVYAVEPEFLSLERQ